MKRRINLAKAVDAEVFGALAVGSGAKGPGDGAVVPFTPAQRRALGDMVQSLVRVARRAGAQRKRVSVGRVSFELTDNGVEEVLSIRTEVSS